jgi:hypothetical protein
MSPLNIGALVQTAMNAVPSDLKQRVTFTLEQRDYDADTDTEGSPVVSTVSGFAAQDKGDADRYAALGLTEVSARTLIFVPDLIGQKPALNATVMWEAATYTVKSVNPIAPGGSAFASSVVVSV